MHLDPDVLFPLHVSLLSKIKFNMCSLEEYFNYIVPGERYKAIVKGEITGDSEKKFSNYVFLL